jgi:cyclic pyranopterin phosphate synthase
MKDTFGRTINYLRISVTDRCNLRCRYCMPASGVKLLRHEDILSFEEIAEVARAAAGMGVTKVRITGGEPLVRHGIIQLVEALAQIEGILDLAMTTNATLLPKYAQALADAGLHRVNISLDTIDPAGYKHLTRGGDLQAALAGIEAAQRAGLTPIKLNCVTDEDGGPGEALIEFGRARGIEVRAIRRMDFGIGSFSVVDGGSGGDCPRCNRLRLSSDGHVRPCLFSDISFSVRELGPAEALERAVLNKPQAGGPCEHNWMHGIGG